MNSIEKLLRDLKAIDPAFEKDEEKLRALLEQLLAAKPDVELNEAFAAELKEKLLERYDRDVTPARIENSEPRESFLGLWNKRLFQSLVLVTTGFLLAFIPLSWHMSTLPESGDTTRISFAPEIERRNENAFGAIPMNTQNTSPEKMGGGNMDDTSLRMLPPESTGTFRFQLQGELPELPESVEVYKRSIHDSAQEELRSFLSAFDLNLIDANAFSNTHLTNISFAEDREFGYNVNIALNREEVSINTNYESWPDPLRECWQEDMDFNESEACQEEHRLTADDVSENEELIRIARDFLEEYDVSIEGYGNPYVDERWKAIPSPMPVDSFPMPTEPIPMPGEEAPIPLEATPIPLDTEESSVRMMLPDSEGEISVSATGMVVPDTWIPTDMQVIFPRHINGTEIVDSAGNPIGLHVSVNIRYRKVSAMYGLTTERYEESEYTDVLSAAEVEELMQQGGLYPPYRNSAEPQELILELGTPQEGYVQFIEYGEILSNEYYVPALLFPVLNPPPGEYFGTEFIIVPLVRPEGMETEPEYRIF